jgi:hypothetical protein
MKKLVKNPVKIPALCGLMALVILPACSGSLPREMAWLAPKPQTSALQSLASGGQNAAQFDTATATERAAATSPALARTAVIGTVSVALGSPSEPGFWLKTALVSAPTQGRAALANGAGVAVTLLPSAGPAQMSLSAYRALGLGLTDVPQVQISQQF